MLANMWCSVPVSGGLCTNLQACLHAWSTQPVWHIRGWHSCPCLSFHVACYRAGSRAVPAVLCLPHLPSDDPGCSTQPCVPYGQQWLACEGLMHAIQALLANMLTACCAWCWDDLVGVCLWSLCVSLPLPAVWLASHHLMYDHNPSTICWRGASRMPGSWCCCGSHALCQPDYPDKTRRGSWCDRSSNHSCCLCVWRFLGGLDPV